MWGWQGVIEWVPTSWPCLWGDTQVAGEREEGITEIEGVCVREKCKSTGGKKGEDRGRAENTHALRTGGEFVLRDKKVFMLSHMGDLSVQPQLKEGLQSGGDPGEGWRVEARGAGVTYRGCGAGLASPDENLQSHKEGPQQVHGKCWYPEWPLF